jgi:hypothetical protein
MVNRFAVVDADTQLSGLLLELETVRSLTTAAVLRFWLRSKSGSPNGFAAEHSVLALYSARVIGIDHPGLSKPQHSVEA